MACDVLDRCKAITDSPARPAQAPLSFSSTVFCPPGSFLQLKIQEYGSCCVVALCDRHAQSESHQANQRMWRTIRAHITSGDSTSARCDSIDTSACPDPDFSYTQRFVVGSNECLRNKRCSANFAPNLASLAASDPKDFFLHKRGVRFEPYQSRQGKQHRRGASIPEQQSGAPEERRSLCTDWRWSALLNVA
jgi:hypothetical protein